MNFSIRQQIITPVLIVACISIGLGMLMSMQLSHIKSNNELTAKTGFQVIKLRGLSNVIYQLEADADHLLYHENSTKEEFKESLKTLNILSNQLGQTYSGIIIHEVNKLKTSLDELQIEANLLFDLITTNSSEGEIRKQYVKFSESLEDAKQQELNMAIVLNKIIRARLLYGKILVNKFNTQIIFFGTSIILLSLIILFLLINGLSRNIKNLTGLITEISKGNFNVDIDTQKPFDSKEINSLRASMHRIMKTMKLAVLEKKEDK